MTEETSFRKTFVKYWDNLIIGIVAGLIVYYGAQIQEYPLFAALFVFIFAILLCFIYSLSIWLGNRIRDYLGRTNG